MGRGGKDRAHVPLPKETKGMFEKCLLVVQSWKGSRRLLWWPEVGSIRLALAGLLLLRVSVMGLWVILLRTTGLDGIRSHWSRSVLFFLVFFHRFRAPI